MIHAISKFYTQRDFASPFLFSDFLCLQICRIFLFCLFVGSPLLEKITISKKQRNETYQQTPGQLLQKWWLPCGSKGQDTDSQASIPLATDMGPNKQPGDQCVCNNLQSKPNYRAVDKQVFRRKKKSLFKMRMQKLSKSKCSFCADPISPKSLQLEVVKGRNVLSMNVPQKLSQQNLCSTGVHGWHQSFTFLTDIHSRSNLGLRSLLSIHSSQRGLFQNI